MAGMTRLSPLSTGEASMSAPCRLASWVIAWFVLAATAPAQEKKPAFQFIDPETVEAFRKLGARFESGIESDVLSFRARRPVAPDVPGLPGFRFHKFPPGKLPEVAVPFGLDLSECDVTDADLKQLAGLKNLVALNLWERKITDAGLKELAGLTNLVSLYLYGPGVTDAGMKELAGLK